MMAFLKLAIILFAVASINCDNIPIDTSQDEPWWHQIASCTRACLETNSSTKLTDCYANCQRANQTEILNEMSSDAAETIRLICRDWDSLTIQVNTTIGETNRILYLVHLEVETENDFEEIVQIADTPTIVITNLTGNTQYSLTASVFVQNASYRRLPKMETFRTLETDNYTPKPIPNDTIRIEYQLKNTSKLPVAVIRWKSEDCVCGYLFGLFSLSSYSKFNSHKDLNRAHFIVKPTELYSFKTKELDYSSRYQIRIAGLNMKNHEIEGPATEREFRVPSCYAFHGFDYDKCVPLTPQNITATHQFGGKKFHYNIDVKWNKPDHLPLRYNVTLFSKTTPPVQRIVAGTEHHAQFDDIIMLDSSYDIHIKAISKAGHSTAYAHSIGLTNVHARFWNFNNNILLIIIFSIPAAMVLCILTMVYKMQCKRKRCLTIATSQANELHELIQSYRRDAMEVKASNIQMDEILGQGAFGIVKRGILKPLNTVVAVKMLKKTAEPANVREFFREIELMKSVRHVNIVGIIGHCTKNENEIMLLTEYCSEGNLLDYLRYFRENGTMQLNTIIIGTALSMEQQQYKRVFDERRLQKQESISMHSEPTVELQNFISNKLYDDDAGTELKSMRTTTIDIESVQQHNGTLFVENHGYDLMTASDGYISPISNIVSARASSSLDSGDLLMIAQQIAHGMAHLADKKIVHRDLAARNVLVCGDKTIKIADFGLSRDIYVDNIYMRSTAGRLPIKWLALESMTKQEYSTKSDIWSFGILLYEIMTFGCVPYPGISTDEILDYLESGKRLKKPEICSDAFYGLMASCWHTKAEHRPNFDDMTEKITNFIDNCDDLNAFSILVDEDTADKSSSLLSIGF